ncbi:MAG TPA: hypothetical protein VL460_02600 [Caulobacteraceae bacterium]|jgi:hypothetical protein|nr:hypothetical protein [Caulobacteraceae bacterium]
MAKDLDDLLGALKVAPLDIALDDLESGVWQRVEERRRARATAGGGLRMQLAVAVAALAMGAVVGGVAAEKRPARSEMVVLSEDAGLTPSVAIEGGA